MSTIYKWNDTEASITAGTVAADDSVLIYDLSAKTMKKASIADINGNSTAVVIGDVTTYAVLVANSGKVHLHGDVTSTNTVTLPAAAAGLNYEFRYIGGAADAQNLVIVPTAGFFIGGLLHCDVGGTTAAVYSNGSSNDVLTIVTPAAGNQIFLVSDGTNWYVNGVNSSATIATFADS
jgi:uncharacterized repeat protein (TIGR01451 family)